MKLTRRRIRKKTSRVKRQKLGRKTKNRRKSFRKKRTKGRRRRRSRRGGAGDILVEDDIVVEDDIARRDYLNETKKDYLRIKSEIQDIQRKESSWDLFMDTVKTLVEEEKEEDLEKRRKQADEVYLRLVKIVNQLNDMENRINNIGTPELTRIEIMNPMSIKGRKERKRKVLLKSLKETKNEGEVLRDKFENTYYYPIDNAATLAGRPRREREEQKRRNTLSQEQRNQEDDEMWAEYRKMDDPNISYLLWKTMVRQQSQ
jgi:hypothetical protein